MNTLSSPNVKDEAWRYADSAALGALSAEALGARQEVRLAEGERWREMVVMDKAVTGLQRFRLSLAVGAQAELFAVLSGPAYNRLDIEVELGEGAHFALGGVTIGGGDNVREIVTRTTHSAPNATSEQIIRSVHWDEAHGNYLGHIVVAQGAQKTDAAQDFRGLLLDKGARANAVPRLEIYADDVKCAHGAAIGALDETAAFYMAARGIPPAIARKLQIRAFIADAFAGLDDDDEQHEKLLAAALEPLNSYETGGQ